MVSFISAAMLMAELTLVSENLSNYFCYLGWASREFRGDTIIASADFGEGLDADGEVFHVCSSQSNATILRANLSNTTPSQYTCCP
jgi:hypothetical protein